MIDLIGRDRPDVVYLIALLVLFLIGLAAVYSASTVISEGGLFGKQVTWSIIGLIAFLVGSIISLRRLEEISPIA